MMIRVINFLGKFLKKFVSVRNKYENVFRFRLCIRTPTFNYENAFCFRFRSPTPLSSTETSFVFVFVFVSKARDAFRFMFSKVRAWLGLVVL